jgi:hypothetical protein
MYIQKFVLTVFLFSVFPFFASAQELTQTIRGQVNDVDTKQPIAGAVVIVLGTTPQNGAESGADGSFTIESVKLGRYSVQVSLMGYNTEIIPEVLITSGKEVTLNITLKEKVVRTEEIKVTADIEKDKPINPNALISARSFSVEEARRFAGSFDDPLRAVQNFSGVTSSANVNTNGIVIRGNSPKGLLWMLDGIDIPNPNHFGYIGQSSGGMTIFSSQVLANSDFFTSAFPSEYGNALSGVFDMKFRNGNKYTREYALQLGIQGLDLSAEGPFKKGSDATYLFNYRYSVLGFLQVIDETMKNKVPSYQDLSFKLNFPTKSAGTFSLFGIGGIAKSKYDPEKDTTQWKTYEDSQMSVLNNTTGTVGLTHNIIVGPKTYINTMLSGSYNEVKWEKGNMNSAYVVSKTDDANYKNSKISFNTFINHKFSSHLTNKTGFEFKKLLYDVKLSAQNPFSGIYSEYINDKGETNLIQAYTQNKIDITDNLGFNAGVHFGYFALNKNYSVEPRIAMRWNFAPTNSISIGYGNHSQLEDISVYLSKKQLTDGTITIPNINLDFGRANHFVVGYDKMFSQNLHLKIETYYQHLYNIPVRPGNYYSMINNPGGYFNDSLVNIGTGKNFGADITFEKFLSENFYYLVTASVFQSKYKGGDGVERNSRYNTGYVFNFILGKEFSVGENNILGVNLKTSYTGGEYYIPIDLSGSVAQSREVLNESRIYTEWFPDFFYVDFTLTYKMNYKKFSGTFALQVKNLLDQKPDAGYVYNPYSKLIEKQINLGIIPMISYKVEF